MPSKIFEDFKERINGSKVAILGLGISHTPLVKFLYRLGAKITVFDSAELKSLSKKIAEFEDLEIDFSVGEGYLSNLPHGFDYVFRTPGIRPDVPEILQAVENGSILTSEMELFIELCPAQIFGITGSDGKTTTTTLIARMLEAEGYHCRVGGNIGTPLLDKIELIQPEEKIILELSSFQLMTLKKSPDIVVITNISPNHLDYHLSYDEYITAKKNIFLFQNITKQSRVVINYDCKVTSTFQEDITELGSELIGFSRKQTLEKGVWIENQWIVYEGYKILKVSDIKLPGVHNVENYMAAIAATAGFVSVDSVRTVARSFDGVEHRIEFIRELNGVKYYNDSIASSPNRTVAGLSSFNQKVILLAGGKDKGIPYDGFGESIVKNCKKIVLIGATADKIHKSINQYLKESGVISDLQIFRCSNYEDLVQTAYLISEPGDIVILSPASTSFDMFSNFEERGRVFKQLVNQL